MLQGEAPATGENREGAMIRLIRKPEDVSNCWGRKPVDRVSWRRSCECCREALFVFYNGKNRMHSKFKIVAPDQGLVAALQHKIDQKTKPLGALGQLEVVAKKIGLIQQSLTPQLKQPQMLVFAGDHGAAKAGVSAFPQEVTWQMVENFLAGGAAINVFSRQNGLALSVVDAGVAHDFGRRPGLIDAKIASGTANYIEQSAMTVAQCALAISSGAEIVRGLAAAGCNVVGFGEMGIGNTAAASLITHRLTGASLAECVGRGTGLDDAGLVRKQGLLEQALQRYRAHGGSDEPLAVLAEFGGFEIAMMAGAMLAAAEAGMVILVDGFIVTSAALTAAKLYPALVDYCVFCHRSAEPGHLAQLRAMNAEPLLDLGLRLGEGTGAALAYPLVQAALSFLSEMASFESAGVAEKS
jgi:nicotinate-nucleotide--dimethylbenzimidazole phosphoribosyltransferase